MGKAACVITTQLLKVQESCPVLHLTTLVLRLLSASLVASSVIWAFRSTIVTVPCTSPRGSQTCHKAAGRREQPC